MVLPETPSSGLLSQQVPPASCGGGGSGRPQALAASLS